MIGRMPPLRRLPGAWRPAALALALALETAPAALAATAEELLADHVVETLGAALPPDARVAVALSGPAPDIVDDVRDFAYDARNGSFRAVLVGAGRLREVAGRASIEIDVPVLTRRVLPGEVITAADVTTMRMPMSRVASSVVTSREHLIGMTGRHQLPPGRPVSIAAIGPQIVVTRNKPVTLIFEDGPLFLSAQGRALQDGGVGESVRVMNIASNLVVTGVATGPQTVTVRP
jgi:flagella basal body P-ring formation protein FlgA